MNGEEEAFVATIRDNPFDDTARFVYADWLEERNDLRSEYLRLVVEIAALTRLEKGVEPLTGRLGTLARSIRQDWREAVSLRYRIVLDLHDAEKESGLIRLFAAGLGFRLRAGKPPGGSKRMRISTPMLREDADQLLRDAGAARWGSGDPTPSSKQSTGSLFRFALELVEDRPGAGEELSAGEVAG
jgi:uncharacterized protein (TIGR02996 family)